MTAKKPSVAANSSTTKPSKEEPVNNIRMVRETVEALVIALALAFFFKAFAAEAFVIPTGSMATTLMGRHKDINCEKCGFPFQISASEESNDASDRPRDPHALKIVLAGTCPQCYFTTYVGPDNDENKTFLSFNGDRIFVNKSQFDFRNPARWHVTVFRYPGNPQINYIKRLVGVENETLQLKHGDVFVKKEGAEEFEIQRKPLRALQAMLRPVDDNDYTLPQLHEIGWPTRWFDDENAWKRSEDYRTFRFSPITQNATAWLNYRHIVPSSDDWAYLSENRMPPKGVVNNPQLITDFVGYNSGITGNRGRAGNIEPTASITRREVQRDGARRKEYFCEKNIDGLGLNWVADIAVACRLTVEKPDGVFLLRLIKGGEIFLCEINLATGTARLSIPGVTEFQPTEAPTPVRGTGTFDLMFCNIDEEMRLIVNGKEIDFGFKGRYDLLCQPGGRLQRDRSPTRLDLQPAGIGVQGAEVQIGHLKILRDMYYIAANNSYASSNCDLLYSPFSDGYSITENSITEILSTPECWGGFGKTKSVTFTLGKDQFLMCGDNSAKSKDSRLWTSDGIPHHVDRNLLIGEAVFVYWPHGLRIPGTRIALIPNFRKVRFID